MRDAIFADEVFTATELNRHAGTILDRARKRPVTISRNNEQFALLPREQAAKLVATVSRIARAVAVLSEANAALAGGSVSKPFEWLTAYGKDDLQTLVAEVLLEARRAASNDGDWDTVEALIHEWRESALVARSGLLDAAMRNSPADEVPLDHPEEVLQSTVNRNTQLK